MSRTLTHRNRLSSETVDRSIATALNERYLVVGNPGPTCYVIKTDKKKFRVVIGESNSCSCREEGCPHIMFVMIKVLKVPEGHSILWQKGANDKEINDLLAGTLARVKQAIGKKAVKRPVKREITSESECPICFEVIIETEDLSHCRKGCGNHVHTACIREWAAHAGGKANCPLCRADWGTVPSRKSNNTTAHPPIEHNSECKQCRSGFIVGVKYSCTRCVGYDLCGSCIQDPLVHPSHQFVECKKPGSKSTPFTRFQQQQQQQLSGLTISGSGIHAGRSLIQSRRRGTLPGRVPRQDSSSNFGICGVGFSRAGSTGDIRNRTPATTPVLAVTSQMERLIDSGSPPIIAEQPQQQQQQPQQPQQQPQQQQLASGDAVSELPFSQFVNESDYINSVCPTCTQQFNYLDTLRCLPCQHVIHSQCAMWWFTECSIVCPICGEDAF